MLRSNVEWNIKEKKYASTVKISIGLLCIALFIACGASKSIDSDVLFSGDIPPLSPMGHFAIIGAATNKSIVIVDISNKKQTGTITFEKIIQGCAISPQDRSIWLTFTFRSNQKGIFKLNFDSKPEIVNLIPDLQGNLHFNHDGRRLYVTPGSEKLYIIDTQSNQLVETVSTITGNHGEGWAFFNASEAQNGLIALTGIPLRFEAVNEGFKVYSDYTKTFLFLLDEKRTVIPLEFVGGFSTPPIFSFDNRLISTLSKEEKSVSISILRTVLSKKRIDKKVPFTQIGCQRCSKSLKPKRVRRHNGNRKKDTGFQASKKVFHHPVDNHTDCTG